MATKTTYLALLRGINVGGKNKVPMAGLKSAARGDRARGRQNLHPVRQCHLPLDACGQHHRAPDRGGADQDLQARRRADQGAGAEPRRAEGGSRQAPQGFWRRAPGNITRRRDLPDGPRRATKPSPCSCCATASTRCGRAMAWSTRRAAERRAHQEQARPHRCLAALQIHDHPQLADHAEAAGTAATGKRASRRDAAMRSCASGAARGVALRILVLIFGLLLADGSHAGLRGASAPGSRRRRGMNCAWSSRRRTKRARSSGSSSSNGRA